MNIDPRTAGYSALAFAAAAGAGLADAHHGYAGFDRCGSVSIEGSLSRVLCASPHVVVTITTDDAQTMHST